jgi:hypothetical protein
MEEMESWRSGELERWSNEEVGFPHLSSSPTLRLSNSGYGTTAR